VGFWDTILRRNSGGTLHFTPNVQWIGGDGDLAQLIDGMSPAQMFRTQPHLRTVVSFLARNVAQLGLHTFERVSDTDRKRDRQSPVARALHQPDVNMTTYDLIYALVGDMALYDAAYWYVGPSSAVSGGTMIRRFPPSWVTPIMANAFEVKSYRVSYDGRYVDIDPANILPFTGYAPGRPGGGSPTIEALKDTLKEQIEASRYRGQVWKRGGRVSAVLERPVDAPKWSPEAREQFREDWYAKYTGRGPKAGGTPILEDGMTLKRIDFNAQEQQFVEGAKLALATVASAFHVNPTMVGQLDNANYSNVREFRRMLYGDTLGPMLAQIEDRLNTFLLPMLDVDPARFYVEFNIGEKLQGSFEEQAAVMSTLVGRPIMSADEGRARFNLPAMGGDAAQLVTPLNVLIGGQASPQDSGSQNLRAGGVRAIKSDAAGVRFKARAPQSYEAKAAQVLSRFFARQRSAVLAALGAKADGDWWDADRWDSELSDDLYALALSTAKHVSAEVLESIGFGPDAYDENRTLKFLRAVADSRAGMINSTTRDQIQAALDGDLDDDAEGSTPAGVFEVAESSRVPSAAAALVTTFSAFATTEAVKQVAGDRATKTWITTSGNPRASHAAMNGETVGVEELFSNGMNWPGDPAGGPDEVAGCYCDVEINIR